MKLLIIGVMVNVILCLLWCGWQYLVALGNAYGNRSSHGGLDLPFLLVICIAVTVAVCISVWFLPSTIARLLLALPLLTLLVVQLTIWGAERRDSLERQQARQEMKAKAQEQLSKVRRDFVCLPGELPLGRKESFLIADVERGVLARVDVESNAHFDTYDIGTVEGNHIALRDMPSEQEKSYYHHFLNGDGKSIFDVYEVTYDKEAGYGVYELRDIE